jgi:hypothetical protein
VVNGAAIYCEAMSVVNRRVSHSPSRPPYFEHRMPRAHKIWRSRGNGACQSAG